MNGYGVEDELKEVDGDSDKDGNVMKGETEMLIKKIRKKCKRRWR